MSVTLKPGNSLIMLKPHDPSRGCVKEQFRMGAACGWDDLCFEAGRLMEINSEGAHWLEENIRQMDGDFSSPKAFLVWDTVEEYAEYLRQERIRARNQGKRLRGDVKPNKPPRLTSAAVSDLDDPAAGFAMETEQAMGDEQDDDDDGEDFSAIAEESGSSSIEGLGDDLAGAAQDDAPPPIPQGGKKKAKAQPRRRTTRKAPPRGGKKK